MRSNAAEASVDGFGASAASAAQVSSRDVVRTDVSFTSVLLSDIQRTGVPEIDRVREKIFRGQGSTEEEAPGGCDQRANGLFRWCLRPRWHDTVHPRIGHQLPHMLIG